MKNSLTLVLMVLFAFTQKVNAQIIRHSNPIVAEEINSTTVWFITTYWYEQAGVPVKDKFLSYSTYEDSLVKIVHKEQGIPFLVAQNAYISNTPQAYNLTPWKIALDRKALGLHGTISQNGMIARYDPEKDIISQETETLTPTFFRTILWFGLLTIVVLVLISFNGNQDHFLSNGNGIAMDISARCIGYLGPLVALLLNGTAADNYYDGKILQTYTQGLFPLIISAAALIFCFALFRLNDYTSESSKSSEQKFPTWTCLILCFLGFAFYGFTHDLMIVLTWFLLGLTVRGFAYAIVQIIKVVKKQAWKIAV